MKKRMKFRKALVFLQNLRIRTKLWLIPVILAVAILATFLLSFFFTSEDSVIQYYHEIAVRQYEFLDYWMERRIEHIEKMACMGDIMDAARYAGNGARIDNNSEVGRTITAILKEQGVYARITLLNKGGHVVYASDGTGAGYAGAFYPRVAGTGDILVGEGYVDPSGGRNKMCVPVSFPVYNLPGERGAINGYLVAHINLDIMKNSLSKINLGDRGAAYIVDNGGSVICSSGDFEFRKRQAYFDDYYTLNGADADEQGYRLVSPETGRMVPGVEKCIDTRHSGYQVYSNHAGLAVVGIWKWMSYMEWVLLLEVDRVYAFMPMYRTLALNFSIALVLSGLALTVAMFFARGINLSLSSFFDFFSKGAGGDLTIRYPLKELECSRVTKCDNRDCPEYGRKTGLCFFEVGSMAVMFGKQTICAKVVNGTHGSCEECIVYQRRMRNEISTMACWFNIFIDRIESVVAKVKEVNDRLTAIAGEMSEASVEFSGNIQSEASIIEEVSASIEEISAGSEQIASSARGQNELLGSLTSRIGELAEVIAVIQVQMRGFLDNYAVMNEKSVRGEGSLKNMNGGLLRIVDGSKRISDSVSIIEDISEQINLLSLNASIEAARVGEIGKGFAVVASEVSRLADKTAHGVKEIETFVGTNFREIDVSLSSMNETISLISEVFSGLNEINSVLDTIARKMEDQNRANAAVTGEMTNVRDMSLQISGATDEQKNALSEIARAIASINTASQSNASSAEELAQRSEEVAAIACDLAEQTGFFKV